MKCNVFLVTSLLSAGVCTSAFAGGALKPCPEHDWSVTLGTSYAVVDGDDTEGNLAPVLLPLTNAPNGVATVSDQNLDYNNAWTQNFSIARSIGDYVTLGLDYEYFQSSVSPGQGVTLVVAPNTSGATYRADLTVNTFLFKGRLQWKNAFSIDGLPVGLFFGMGIGTAHLKMSKQADTVFNSGDFTFALSNHSRWAFAYSMEMGVINPITCRWSIEYGIRYTSYGTFSSGTHLVNYPSVNMKKAVAASVYSIAPFFGTSYHFY